MAGIGTLFGAREPPIEVLGGTEAKSVKFLWIFILTKLPGILLVRIENTPESYVRGEEEGKEGEEEEGEGFCLRVCMCVCVCVCVLLYRLLRWCPIFSLFFLVNHHVILDYY